MESLSTEKKMWHDAEEKAIQCLISIADHIQGRVERDELEIDAVLDAAEKAEEIARFSRKMQMHREITCREKLCKEHPEAMSNHYAERIMKKCKECRNMPYTGEKS